MFDADLLAGELAVTPLTNEYGFRGFLKYITKYTLITIRVFKLIYVANKMISVDCTQNTKQISEDVKKNNSSYTIFYYIDKQSFRFMMMIVGLCNIRQG